MSVVELDMYEEKPDIRGLERAIVRLDEGLQRYQSDTTDLQIRDGLIQRFEFTYEMSCKTLKRYLEYAAAAPEQIDIAPFQDLIRMANEQGLLLGEWPDWKRYRDMRSRTSHTYDEDVALGVVADIPEFLREAKFLCETLRKRLV